MMNEHRASFLVSVAALCGRRLRLARLRAAGNGVFGPRGPAGHGGEGSLGVEVFG